MQKIRQRFQLAHQSPPSSPNPMENESKHDNNNDNNQQQHHQPQRHSYTINATQRRRPNRHKKKRSLGEAIFKHLPAKIKHHIDMEIDPSDDDHNNISSDTTIANINFNNKQTTKPLYKKSSSFSHGNNKHKLMPLKKNRFRKHHNNKHHNKHHNNNNNNNNHSGHHSTRKHRSNSNGNRGIHISTLPEAEEDAHDFGDDVDLNEEDFAGLRFGSFSFSSSGSNGKSPPTTKGGIRPQSPETRSNPLPKLKKSMSTSSVGSDYGKINVSSSHSMQNSGGRLPPPQSPRRDLEHEKNTLIDQMRQLQHSMTQLGQMLNDQDNKLLVERQKNEKLTEQVNNLADENIALRQQIHQHRQDRNSIWHDLEFYKLSARQCKDKNILLSHQVLEITKQKDNIQKYSESLLKQLNEEKSKLSEEKQKTHQLKLKIRKYSKNVKSLHKKTHSMSGLQKYQAMKMKMKKPRSATVTKKEPEFVQLTLGATSDPGPIGLTPQTDLGIIADSDIATSPIMEEQPESKKDVNEITNNHLQQKRRELAELEKQTLDILNQLQEETKQLLGETQDLAGRSHKRLNGKSPRHKRRRRHGKKKHMSKSTKQGSTDDNDDDIILSETETTKLETKTKLKTRINGAVITKTETKTETKTKTKTKYNRNKMKSMNGNTNTKGNNTKTVTFASDDTKGIHNEGYVNNGNENETNHRNTTNNDNKSNDKNISITFSGSGGDKSTSNSSDDDEEEEVVFFDEDEHENDDQNHQNEGNTENIDMIKKLEQGATLLNNQENKKRNSVDLDPKEVGSKFDEKETENKHDDMVNNDENVEIEEKIEENNIADMPMIADEDDDEDEYEDQLYEQQKKAQAEQAKQHVDALKKSGAGISSILDAFKLQMDAEESDCPSSENEEPMPFQPPIVDKKRSSDGLGVMALSNIPDDWLNDDDDDAIDRLDDFWG